MTGTIRALCTDTRSGIIKSENGLDVSYDNSEVMAYDVGLLAVGHVVTFEVDDEHGLAAVNVCIESGRQSDSTPDRFPLRYIGFDQTRNIRLFKFERRLSGQGTQFLLVSSDLDLFAANRVKIQDGPGICLHILMLELALAGPAGIVSSSRCLTQEHLLAHLASLPQPAAKRPYKKPAHSPIGASQIRLQQVR